MAKFGGPATVEKRVQVCGPVRQKLAFDPGRVFFDVERLIFGARLLMSSVVAGFFLESQFVAGSTTVRVPELVGGDFIVANQ